MAAWGTGLYQDDIAEDIKFDYHNYFKEGLNNQEAYAKLLERYDDVINDPEDQSVFWFALADTMWNLGKLTKEVKEQALSCIANGKDVERWKAEDEKKAEKRQQVLEKLKEKLESPMPEEKKIGKKRVFKNKWEIGDMYVMPIVGQYPRFPEMKAKYLLLIKLDDSKDLKDHIQPVVYIKYLEEEYYEGMDINELKFSRSYDYGFRFVISGIAGRPKPKELTYVGSYGDISNLRKPEQPGEKVKDINCNCMWYVKSLEHACVSVYLMYILNIDGRKLGGEDIIHMTEEEYQRYCLQVEENRIKSEEKKIKKGKRKSIIYVHGKMEMFFIFL